MQFVIRFCTVCQKDTMVQVLNNGDVYCLEHEPYEPSKQDIENQRNDDAYIARRCK